MKNAAGREIPDQIRGIDKYQAYIGKDGITPQGNYGSKSMRKSLPATNKVLNTIEEAIKATGLKNGDRISFHHHFRNGDFVVELVLKELRRLGFKDMTLAPSSLADCHDFLPEYIQDGTVTAIETSGLRGGLGRFLTQNPNALKRPAIVRSHGGRARAIASGEVKIDVAFLGVPCADKFGNANGVNGQSACGSLGYAMVDARYAEKVVLLTDNLIDGFANPISIPQTHVDYIVPVEVIGNPKKIASGAVRITQDPVQLYLAQQAAEVIEHAGYLKEGFSFQLGAGGSSLAVAQFVRQKMIDQNIKGGFQLGGSTGIGADLLTEGMFKVFYDTQSFDTTAAASLRDNAQHIEIDAGWYADPWGPSPSVNELDIVCLASTEVDVDFNVNVITDSNGVLMGASGGHSDTAYGAKLAIILTPVLRGRLPMILDQVQTIVTPGDVVDVIVTDHGIAVNPKRPDLLEALQGKGLNLKTMKELQEIAHSLVGKPEPLEYTDDIVAVIEYRDGSIIDVVRKPK